MALKLGKCRLCLKLGDFYSIYTVDNGVQLAEMVMECAKINVYEGDGLPDKVCSECIQKLSGAYIFKQQCERADRELRRNYVVPAGAERRSGPGPASAPDRQSSDSAFSTHTDSSNLKSSLVERETTPASGARKRSVESDEGRAGKRARRSPSPADSAADWGAASPRAPDSDSDSAASRAHSAPHRCHVCRKTFKYKTSLDRHAALVHRERESSPAPPPAPPPASSAAPSPAPLSELSCDRCDGTFKLRIALEKHREGCDGRKPPREPLISLEPIDAIQRAAASRKPVCEYCTAGFKSVANLEKHLRVVHAAILKRESGASFQCRVCRARVRSQAALVLHLAAHAGPPAPPPAPPPPPPPAPGPAASEPAPAELACHVCDKRFKYKKSLASHERKHTEDEAAVKREPPDAPPEPEPERDEGEEPEPTGEGDGEGEGEEEEDEEEEDELTCDVCDKMFSYRRVLEQHKRTKHNMSSGTRRARIALKDCAVRCLICDLEMKVSTVNDHNQRHISENVRPRNVYTCAECQQRFKSCSNLATHIKLVHRLKQRVDQVPRRFLGASVADLCEVVAAEPEPAPGPAPGPGGPAVEVGGLACHVCGKTMPTLVSLKRHVNWHVNVGDRIEANHECFVCKERFRFRCHLRKHMRTHYADPALDPALLECDVCGRRSKNLRAARAHMNYHKQTRFRTADYECSICKRVLQHRRVYLAHMALHHRRGDSARSALVGAAPAPAPPGAGAPAHACHLCGAACDSETALKHHLVWHESRGVLYGARHACALCPLVFTNKRRLELHTRAHYEDDAGPHRCPVCDKGYTDEGYMRRHLKGHNFDNAERARAASQVQCGACPRRYASAERLARHVRRAHPAAAVKEEPGEGEGEDGALACSLCARVFPDARRLRLHERAHARRPTFLACKFCGMKNISARRHRLHLRSHLTRKHRDAPLRCPRCPDTFVLGYALHRHLRDAHGVEETWAEERAGPAPPPAPGAARALQCDLCGKVLASEGNLERHLDYHDSLRCNYCFERFSGARFLEGHQTYACRKRRLVGASEPHARRLRCPRCREPFHLRVKLECHLRVRHGERAPPPPARAPPPVACDYCFREFPDAAALASHRVYHRSVAHYGCRYCPRRFPTPAAFRRHRTSHLYRLDPERPSRCAHCPETFVAFRDMIRHQSAAHGDDEWLVPPADDAEQTCPVCSKRFLNLRRHLDYHEENRCARCGEYFSSRGAFDAHRCPLEADEAPPASPAAAPPAPPADAGEECAFCFKAITRRDSRRKHDALHAASGAISCRFCDAKFKTLTAFEAHAFSHRSRKYARRPLECGSCGARFDRYGPFVRHRREAHACRRKMHYRGRARAAPCVVCGGSFPNLHNHYRAHLANRCADCRKYFTSARLFAAHRCERADAEPARVFLSDADLPALIRAHVPADESDADEKFYRQSDEEGPPDPRTADERSVHDMAQAPIISDVLSLFRRADEPETVLVLDSD